MGSNTSESRANALRDVISLRNPLDESLAALAQFDWDSNEELIVLTPDDVILVLKAFREGRLNAADCERWAEALHGRDDVELQGQGSELIEQFLFEASTPELFDPLEKSATEWLERLRQA